MASVRLHVSCSAISSKLCVDCSCMVTAASKLPYVGACFCHAGCRQRAYI
jgi:hypothetical protein